MSVLVRDHVDPEPSGGVRPGSPAELTPAGMGDTCCLPFSMGAIEAMIVDAVPGAYVTSLMIGKNEADDEKNGEGALRGCWK